MTNKPSRNGTHTSDRRRNTRLPARDRVQVQIPEQHITGRLDNVSGTGVLFFSDDEVTVTVEIEEDGVVKQMTGRIVRAQQAGGTVGWAVELD